MTDGPTVAGTGPDTPRRRPWSRRLLLALAGAGVLTALVVAAVLLRREPAEPVVSAPFRIELAGPHSIGAGESWTFEITAPRVADGERAAVTVTGPWGSGDLTASVADGSLTVPAATMTRSGVVAATVQIGEGTGVVSVEVEPGPAIDGTTPLAGPRSMVADLRHWTMVSMLPRDRFGNVIADGSPVDVVVRRPDGSVERVGTEVRNLVAALRVFSTTRAGRSTIRVDVDDATGPEVEVLEVPGPPVDFGLGEDGPPLRSDGRQLFVVTTDRLVDRFGNELLDGTAAVATLDTPTGRTTSRSVTIDGTAEFVIETPTAAGPVTVEVVVDGVRSEPLRLEVAPDVTDVPVAIELDDGVLRIRVGSVLTGLGGFVPDGTDAEISVDGRTATIALVDGSGVLELPWPPSADGPELPDEVVVRVLGASRTVRPG